MANVLPVAKVHPPVVSVDNDLRPISVTPTISKLLEVNVGGWILDAVVDKLDTRQFGALKGRSTTHALIDMLHHWHAAVDSGSSVPVLFVDFAKAFDHTDHNLVIHKLRRLQLPNIIIDWISSFLCNRYQRIAFDGYFRTGSRCEKECLKDPGLVLWCFLS